MIILKWPYFSGTSAYLDLLTRELAQRRQWMRCTVRSNKMHSSVHSASTAPSRTAVLACHSTKTPRRSAHCRGGRGGQKRRARGRIGRQFRLGLNASVPVRPFNGNGCETNQHYASMDTNPRIYTETGLSDILPSRPPRVLSHRSRSTTLICPSPLSFIANLKRDLACVERHQ